MSIALVLHCRRAPAGVAGALESLLPRLPYAKRLELEGRDAAARFASLAGIAMLMDGVARLTGRRPEPSALSFPQDGRPYLEGGPHFSVSHSGDCVGVAVCADAAIGFDLECLPDGWTPEARDHLQRWTAIEAVLKAAGCGLREAAKVDLRAPSATALLAGIDYRLYAVPLPGSVVAHLACSGAIETIAVEAWSVPAAGD